MMIRRLIAALLLAPLLLAATGWVPSAYAKTCSIGPVGETIEMVLPLPSLRKVSIHYPSKVRYPVPLLFVFHGSGGNGRQMLDYSKLADTADAKGFIVVAPDGGIPMGKGFVWNIPGVPATGGRMPLASDADDVAFVKQTIDSLVGDGCVDPARVYATGLSGGGRMASWLACVAADRFAAIAPVVGLRAGNPLASDTSRPDPATCRPSRPMPVMTFAGDADTTNPIAGGGAPYWQYPMAAAEARWAEINGCRTSLPRLEVAPQVYEEGYAGCRTGADVRARVTVGGKHAWVVDNDAMWAFLSKYRRR